MSKNSLKAATLAAAKVNAMLYAKGKLKLPDGHKNQSMHGVNDRSLDNLITREYEINDVPAPARNLLTRGFVQDEICKYSGASISTRGRYITYEERLNMSSKDRPLYLHIQGSSKEAVNLAMARIQEMIAQFDKSFKPSSEFADMLHSARLGATTPQASSGGHYVQDKVFVGLESSSSSFSVRERILGPNGSFLQHIKVESGATVTLRGRGSGYIEPTSGQEAFEPMYIHLTHPKPEGLQTAKTLALNLIDTVHAEYALFQQQSVQALMPVNINPHSNISFPGHVPVVSNVPTVLNHNLISSAPQGFLPAVSVSSMLGPSLTVPVSQGLPVYTSTNGIQHTFVNTLPIVTTISPHSLQTLNSVPVSMNSVPPVNINPIPAVALNPVTALPLTTEQALTLGSVPSVPLDATPVPLNTAPVSLNTPPVPLNTAHVPLNATPVPLNAAPLPLNTARVPLNSAPVQLNTAPIPLNTARVQINPPPVPINPVPAELVAPSVTHNPVTSIPLSSMSSFAINPVTSLPVYTFPPVSVNPMTTVFVSTMNPISVNSMTSVHGGLLRPTTTTTSSGNAIGALPGLELGLPLHPPTGQQPMRLNQPVMSLLPPMPQPTTGYRADMVMPAQSVASPVPVAMPQQPLPPTMYTHLYIKQQQQINVPLPMPGVPPPVQHGHKRKFREEGPNLMPPPPSSAVMIHQPPYRLEPRWCQRPLVEDSAEPIHLSRLRATLHTSIGPDWQHPNSNWRDMAPPEMWNGT